MQWDPDELRYDWDNHVVNFLPRNALIQAVNTVDPEHEMYNYYHRPVPRECIQGTIYERILEEIPLRWNRVVFIAIPPGSCLRQHWDPEDKYHISVIEQEGSFYYDFDTCTGHHMPADGRLRVVNSGTTRHTAVNASTDYRVHMVMTEWQCEDEAPQTTYEVRTRFDYSNCNSMHLFEDMHTGKLRTKRDIRSTIEQAFIVPTLSKSYSTKKVFSSSAHNLDTGREYVTHWTDLDELEKFNQSDLVIEVQEALREFGVTIERELID